MSSTAPNTWTRPFHGVSHSATEAVEMTTCSYGTFTEASVTILPRRGFTPDHKQLFFAEPWADDKRTDAVVWDCGEAHTARAQAWCDELAAVFDKRRKQ